VLGRGRTQPALFMPADEVTRLELGRANGTTRLFARANSLLKPPEGSLK